MARAPPDLGRIKLRDGMALMEQNLELTLALLARTPATLDAMLRNLPDAWTQANEGEKTFNAFQVVGHLAHGERSDWMPRVKMILEFGEGRAFVPFDRFAQDRESEGKSLPQLLDEFSQLRAGNLSEIRALNLTPQDLERRGTHPRLGSVTLGNLLSTWAAHDMTHLHQLARIMAHQYRDAVGPWTVFLGVLQCNGHSAG
jgi:DinB superfamily